MSAVNLNVSDLNVSECHAAARVLQREAGKYRRSAENTDNEVSAAMSIMSADGLDRVANALDTAATGKTRVTGPVAS